jgi:histidinol-phosphatase (PHP family)
MEEMVKAAIDDGFEHWGFSPHSPVPIESPCNMSHDSVKSYFDEVTRLKEVYGDRISLYASMEIDYLGAEWGPSNPYFDTLPLDYRIGSVHFVPSADGLVDVDGSEATFIKKMDRYFNNDIHYVVNSFYDESIKMVEAGGFDIIGHFDKIGRNAAAFKPGIESESWYIKRVNDLIDAIVEHGPAVEINTKAWNDVRRLFPRVEYLPRLFDAGITVLVNSDAHYPDKVDAGRATGLEVLNKLEETSINSNILCQ